MKFKRIFWACAFALIGSQASAFELSGSDFEKVGIEKNIDPVLLYSVALAESAYSSEGSTSGASPYPWTLRTRGEAFYAESKAAAAQHLNLILQTTRSVDIGLMQVNYRWHRHRVARAEDLLDPLTNLRVGADILNENLARLPDDLVSALGSYHSGNPARRQIYGLTVFTIYESLKANGRHRAY